MQENFQRFLECASVMSIFVCGVEEKGSEFFEKSFCAAFSAYSLRYKAV